MATSKRLLLTAFADKHRRQFYDQIEVIHSAYARLFHFDYKNVEIKESHFGNWFSIPILYKYIDLYDEIILIDYDILIKKPHDLFEIEKNECIFYMNDKNPSSKFMIRASSVDEKIIVKNFLSILWKTDTKNFDLAFEQLYSSNSDFKKLVCFSNKLFTDDLYFKISFETYKLTTDSIIQKYYYRLINKEKQKRIGIVIRAQNFYSNGAGQNCIFMRQTFEACGYEVDFISHQKSIEHASTELPYKIQSFDSIEIDKYCLFIFGSIVLFDSDIKTLRQKKIKCVMFNPCNVIDQFHQENFLYKEKSSKTPLFEMKFREICDEIWITDNHSESSLEYLEIINRHLVPVKKITLMWSELFLFKNYKLPKYTVRSPDKQIDFVIIEPNLGYCKSGWLPLTICEDFYLKHSEKVNKVYFFNTPGTETALGMIKSLKLSEDNRVRCLKRLPINEILDFFCDPERNNGNHVIFLSHSINSPLNYAYFDILFSGFPFIHNSPYLARDGIGFYYKTLYEASNHVNECLTINLELYQKKALSYLSKINPYAEPVIKQVNELVESIVNDTKTPSYLSVGEKGLSNEIVLAPTFHDMIQIIVICCSEQRKNKIIKMYSELKIPFDINFYEGYTPSNSKDFINYKHTKYPETDATIFCSRSHAGAIHKFVNHFPKKDILVVLEDDIIFKKDFTKQLEDVYLTWQKHQHEIDYVNIGYLLVTKPNPKMSDSNLFWNSSNSLWGAQGYMVKRKTAIQMADILYKSTSEEMYHSMILFLQNQLKSVPFANNWLLLSTDHFLPMLWKQGFVEPPLVLEDRTVISEINQVQNNFRKIDPTWKVNFDDYYSL